MIFLVLVIFSHVAVKGWEKAMRWCYHGGSELHLGDFNGDGRFDLLCHDSSGYKWIALADVAGTFTGTSWHKGMAWCYHQGSQLYIGDFNGDKCSDMLCHDIDGHVWIAYSNSEGHFHRDNVWFRDMGWCKKGELLIGDFNGDGRDDMTCDVNSGTKLVSLANKDGTFGDNSFQLKSRWCTNFGSELYIGDFNGDGRTDWLCHDIKGRTWIGYASSDGKFTGSGWFLLKRWCYHQGSTLHIGDFNGDGRDDLLCHGKDGTMLINSANSYGHFGGTTWSEAMEWCYHGSAQIFVGDFDGNNRTDIMCHDTTSGHKSIKYSPGNGRTGRNWMKDIGGTKRLSLYSIPGTHDSAAYGHPVSWTLFFDYINCQKYDISTQLAIGVRYFDIRVAKQDQQWVLRHNEWSLFMNFKTHVLNPIYKFLAENPQECIIMRIKRDGHYYSVTPHEFSAIFNTYYDRNPERWLLRLQTPTLNECRAKIYVLREGWNAPSGMNVRPIESEFPWQDEWHLVPNMDTMIIDGHIHGYTEMKKGHIVNFHQTHNKNNNFDQHRLHINHWSYAGHPVYFAPTLPHETAQGMRELNLVPTLMGRYLGICVFDFITEFQAEQVLCRNYAEQNGGCFKS